MVIRNFHIVRALKFPEELVGKKIYNKAQFSEFMDRSNILKVLKRGQ